MQNLCRGKSGPAAGPSGDRQEDHGLVAGGQALVVAGRLQQRSRTADGSARSVVEVVAEELGPSLRWATATTTRSTRSQDR